MSKKSRLGESPSQTEEPKKTVEQLALEQSTPRWLFAAAKQKYKWPVGKELTATEFSAALAATGKHKAGK